MSSIGFAVGVLLGVVVGGKAIEEGSVWRAAVHTAALMGPLGVVGDEVGIEGGLHLLDGLEPGAPSFDAEVFVEQGAMEALDDAVGLWPLHAGLAMRDALELEEQLVGMAVGPAAE